MLSIASYPKAYVADCRRKVDAQMEAYAGLTSSPAFNGPFFRHMLLALDHYFDHRARGQEGKDGNALNELRMLCKGVMGDGRVAPDSKIRLKGSATGLSVGDVIDLDARAFSALAGAVFAQIEARYP